MVEPNNEAEIAGVKYKLDSDRKELELFVLQALRAVFPGHDADKQAAVAEQHLNLELRKLAYDMSASDFQKAMHDAAEARARLATEQHQQEMKTLEKEALARAAQSDSIQQAMVKATESMTRATWAFGAIGALFGAIGAALVAVQAYKTVNPSPVPPWPEPSSPVTSSTK